MRLSLTGITCILLTLPAAADTTEWRLDPAHCAAEFAVRHMMVSTVRGSFGKVTGTAQIDDQDITKSSVDVSIDTTALTTREAKRDAHLKSPDFFDVEKFPSMTFKSKRVEKAGEGRIRLVGDLTIHGITREAVFDVEGPTPPLKGMGGLRRGAAATTRINRKDFGLVWNRTLETGGVVVGDEVQVTVDVEMVSGGARAAR